MSISPVLNLRILGEPHVRVDAYPLITGGKGKVVDTRGGHDDLATRRRLTQNDDRHRGESHDFPPPTPPCERDRTRRLAVGRYGSWFRRTAGFRVSGPQRAVRSLLPSREASPLASSARPVPTGSSAAFRSFDPCSYSPFHFPPILIRGTIRAFGPLHLLCPLLTSAPRSARLSTRSVLRTRCRSPGVSSTAFGSQPPDLRFAVLMDMDFVMTGSLVHDSRLLSGSCPSARSFAPRFLQTNPHELHPCASLTLHLHQVE